MKRLIHGISIGKLFTKTLDTLSLLPLHSVTSYSAKKGVLVINFFHPLDPFAFRSRIVEAGSTRFTPTTPGTKLRAASQG
jgi:hypothetical protein